MKTRESSTVSQFCAVHLFPQSPVRQVLKQKHQINREIRRAILRREGVQVGRGRARVKDLTREMVLGGLEHCGVVAEQTGISEVRVRRYLERLLKKKVRLVSFLVWWISKMSD
jgi:hypothetical protein